MTSCQFETTVLSFKDDDQAVAGMVSDTMDAQVALLKNLIRTSHSQLTCFIPLLRKSRVLRDISPLLIEDLLEVLMVCDTHLLTGIIAIFDFFPKCFRPLEMYTFCMESWVNLHKRTCGNNSDCRIALGRSVVASMITDVITRTEKGPLFRNRVDYLMSFGLQLMSKYFNSAPVHAHDEASNSRMVSSLLRIVESLGSRSSQELDKSVEFEVSIKLIASLVRFNARARLRTDSCELSDLLFRIDPSVLNLITTRLQLLHLNESRPSDDSGDYEILDTDIAALVLAIPAIVPLIWSASMRLHHLLISSLIILKNFQDDPSLIRLAVCEGLKQLSGHFFQSSAELTLLLRLVIEISTSVGDEDLLSLTERKSAYELVYGIMTRQIDPIESVETCFTIVSQSRIDACVGIFVKIAKDIESKKESNDSAFYRFSRSILESLDVVNSTDSLKSILNWARLFYLSKKFERNKAQDDWVYLKLGEVAREIDVEQSQCESGSVQQNRIIFIGHLVNRVRELV